MIQDAADERYLDAARACVRYWEEEEDGPVAVRSELEVKFRVCFPLIAHAMNHVRQGVELYFSRPLVSVSSARIALELALTAQWVLLTHAGEVTLVNHMTHSWMTRARDFARGAGEEEALGPILDRPPIDGHDRSFSMTLIFGRFDSSGLFYDVYRDLSQAVHPSYGMISAHMDFGRDGSGVVDRPSRISRTGRLARNSSAALGLGLAAVLACEALERLRDDSPGLTRIEQIASAASLPSDLRLSDREPDLQRP